MKNIMKGLVATAVMTVSACLPIFANATTLTFDDLSDSQQVANGYGGLNWSNFYALDTTTYQYQFSGYINGVVSLNNVLYNGGGSPAEFSSPTPFTFNSVYLTAAWNNGLTVAVTGYLAGTQVESNTFTLNTNSPTLETFNWTNVDRVRFVSSGGTAATRLGSAAHFATDNLTINATVPEPTTVALIGLGLLGFAASRRKAAKSKNA